MDFADAMKIVLAGGRVRREDWNRVSHVELRHGSPSQVIIVMKSRAWNAYSPSQCDMLVKDWLTVR